jgi:hypothetical protein
MSKEYAQAYSDAEVDRCRQPPEPGSDKQEWTGEERSRDQVHGKPAGAVNCPRLSGQRRQLLVTVKVDQLPVFGFTMTRPVIMIACRAPPRPCKLILAQRRCPAAPVATPCVAINRCRLQRLSSRFDLLFESAEDGVKGLQDRPAHHRTDDWRQQASRLKSLGDTAPIV